MLQVWRNSQCRGTFDSALRRVDVLDNVGGRALFFPCAPGWLLCLNNHLNGSMVQTEIEWLCRAIRTRGAVIFDQPTLCRPKSFSRPNGGIEGWVYIDSRENGAGRVRRAVRWIENTPGRWDLHQVGGRLEFEPQSPRRSDDCRNALLNWLGLSSQLCLQGEEEFVFWQTWHPLRPIRRLGIDIVQKELGNACDPRLKPSSLR